MRAKQVIAKLEALPVSETETKGGNFTSSHVFKREDNTSFVGHRSVVGKPKFWAFDEGIFGDGAAIDSLCVICQFKELDCAGENSLGSNIHAAVFLFLEVRTFFLLFIADNISISSNPVFTVESLNAERSMGDFDLDFVHSEVGGIVSGNNNRPVTGTLISFNGAVMEGSVLSLAPFPGR